MKKLAILLSALLLGACGDTQTAYVSEGDSRQSLSVIREQAYLGGPWRTTLVAAAVPQCQRRYSIEEAAGRQFAIAVHRPAPGMFILDAGQRWYVVELPTCSFQPYKTPPPEPGERAGGFEIRDGTLRYVAAAPHQPVAAGVARP